MTLLAPFSAVIAAIVAGSILLTLYMLRLLRPTLRVPSTLLWSQKPRDLEANTPFQRLRWSLLLLIQLLIAACLVLALGQPVTRGSLDVTGRTVLLIDHTASMNMVGLDGLTRLDHAKIKATELARQILSQSTSGSNQVMVVGVASEPQILTGFQSSLMVVEQAIDGLEPTDESADIRAAMELAASIAQGSNDQSDTPGVVLISDGVGARPNGGEMGLDVLTAAAKLHWIPIDDGLEENIGIVSFSVRRDHRDPTALRLLAQVINSGPKAVETTLVFEVIAGDLAGEMLFEPVTIPEATTDAPGKTVVAARMNMASAGVIKASLGTETGLSADNQATVTVDALKLPKVVVVTPSGQDSDAFLVTMLTVLVPDNWEQWDLATYEMNLAQYRRVEQEGGDVSAWVGGDLVIFDGIAIDSDMSWPPVDSMTFQPQDETTPAGRRVISWDRTDPLLQHVAMDDLVFVPGEPIDQDDQLKAIADSRDGPVIAVSDQGTTKHVVVGFRLSESTWSLQPGGIVFMQNALDLQVGGGAGTQGRAYAPGQTAELGWPTNATELQLNGRSVVQLPSRDSDVSAIELPRRSGLYEVTDSTGVLADDDPAQAYLAVNLASRTESDLRKVPRVDVGGKLVAAGGPVEGLRALWPWLVALALLLLAIEWLIYTSQRRGT